MSDSRSNTDESSGLLVDIHGTKAATYKGLLAKAHDMGLLSIHTEMVVCPESDGDLCVFKATVEMIRGDEPVRTFVGYGDATPKTVKAMVKPHYIRMAETRAKSRALRDAVNVGVVSEDELLALRPDEDKARELKARKLALVRAVGREMARQRIDGLDPRAFVVKVVRDVLGTETIDDGVEMDAVEEAIKNDGFDLATGDRIPDLDSSAPEAPPEPHGGEEPHTHTDEDEPPAPGDGAQGGLDW
jgi:hypothetical protein